MKASLVGVLAAGACAPYTVVQRTEPSALLGARRVVVDSDWSQVDIAGAGQPADRSGRSGPARGGSMRMS